MKDLFGKALLDYYNGNYTEDLVTATSISTEDILPLPYLFRSFDDMPKLEQEALKLAKGHVLDVGCGSGCHSLYLQNNGLEVVSIDISEGAVEVAQKQGLKNVHQIDFHEVTGTFDTVLMLMNGAGILKSVKHAPECLSKLKSLLKPNGQALVDSSDLSYMYHDEDEDFWVDLNASYYGELDYFVSYKGEKEEPFSWLYADFYLLRQLCDQSGLDCKLACEGDHYDYLARITHK